MRYEYALYFDADSDETAKRVANAVERFLVAYTSVSRSHIKLYQQFLNKERTEALAYRSDDGRWHLSMEGGPT